MPLHIIVLSPKQAMIVALLFAAAAVPLLWKDPGVPASAVDFSLPARSVASPVPPFEFVQEELSGTSPKVLVRDATGRIWQVKGGPEGRVESFVTRFVSALGYYADAVSFVKYGQIQNVAWPLRRAGGFIGRDGRFTYAGFELRDPKMKYLSGAAWRWSGNPFAGTRELRCLKLLVMLFSNWDNKDARDKSLGSNTGVLRIETGEQTADVYFISDWGQSLGSWGKVLRWGRSNWNCGDFRSQSEDFLRILKDGSLRFGYRGQHNEYFGSGIGTEDLKWLLLRLGSISEDQIRAGLRASGATEEEERCFAAAIARRVELMKRAAASGTSEIR